VHRILNKFGISDCVCPPHLRMPLHYLVKCSTCFLHNSYNVFRLKSGWLWKQSVATLYRNLNFEQAVSLKLLKIIIVCRWHTLLVFLDTDLPHHPLSIQPMSQQIADAAGVDTVLFSCTGVYTRSLYEFLWEPEPTISHQPKNKFHFYCTMLCSHGICYGPVSVCAYPSQIRVLLNS